MNQETFNARVAQLMHRREQEVSTKADKIFAALMGLQWVAAVVAALVISPRTWVGPASHVHPHVVAAALLGGLIAMPPLYVTLWHTGRASNRFVVAVSQMLFSALLIHVSNGRIETHFHIFGSLAFLAFYRDWRVLVPATLVIALDHLIRGLYFPESVFGLNYSAPWRAFEHATWVLFEDAFLGYSCVLSRREMAAASRDEAELQCAYEGVEATVRDRTRDLEQAKKDIHQERTVLVNVLNNIPCQVFWKDSESRYLGCNQPFAAVAGLASSDKVVGRTDLDLPWSEAEAQAFRADDQEVMRSGLAKLDIEESQKIADGRTLTLLTSKVPLKDEQGVLLGVLGVAVDITERRQLQSQLLQAQKLESIGQLAAGIAHEINTPVQYVSDNVRFLKDQFGALMQVTTHSQALCKAEAPDVPLARAELASQLAALDFEFLSAEVPLALEQSLDGLDRVATIVRAMKEFSHPGSTKMEPADINKAIKSTATVCTNRWKYVAELHLELDANLPPVPCLVAEFNQVVLNLIVNAADAIGEHPKSKDTRGNITVRTKALVDAVEIRVEDDGPGIPEAVQKKMFEPFFTTKAVGKGTGQGLAISRNVIVKKHGGTLRFESAVGTGTTFIITLPLVVAGDSHGAEQAREAA